MKRNRAYNAGVKLFLETITISGLDRCLNKESRSSMIKSRVNNQNVFMKKAGLALLLAAYSGGAFAQDLTYDGTNVPAVGIATLELGTALFLPAWMNLNSGDHGLIYRNDLNSIVPTDADLIVDYTTGPTPKFVIGGYSPMFGFIISDNTVKIEQGAVDGSVYGGLSHNTSIQSNLTGAPSGNDTSADASAYVTSASASANQNTVSVGSRSIVTGEVYGGNATAWAQAGGADAGGNAAAFSSSFFNASASVNAYADASSATVNANSNTITLSANASASGSIYGGYSNLVALGANATARDASITGSASVFTIAVAVSNTYATASFSAVNANGNSISIDNGASVDGSLYGGYANLVALGGNATSGNATSTATGLSSTASASAFSYASADNSILTANSNIIELKDTASVTGSIYGGYANLAAQGANATAGNASAIGNANAFAYTNTYASASVSTVTAGYNTIAINSDVSITGNIYGGYANLIALGANAIGGNATATNAYNLTNAYAYIYDSIMIANSNSVTVHNGASVTGNIYGGYAGLTAQAGQATGGKANGVASGADATVDASNAKVSAENNVVTFDGVLQSGSSIYGGYTKFDITQGSAIKQDLSSGDNSVNLTGSQVRAINNIVTIGLNAQINGSNTSIYGGYLEHKPSWEPESYDVFTGNTLNFSAQPVSVNSVANFEHYNFVIEPSLANTGTALVNAKDIQLGANVSNVSTNATTPSSIKVVGIHSGNILSAGDQFILMQSTNTFSGNANGLSSTGVAQQGISLLYDVSTAVDLTNKQITATILPGGSNAARVNPQLKALSEGYLAGAMLVSRGADLIVDDAFRAINEQNQNTGLTPFVVMSGQHNRYQSGSHIKSNDFLLTGGLSYQQNNFTTGGFLESGWGSYDTYNSFYDAITKDVLGDGNDRYYGLGLLGRYDLTNGLYTDTSIRFGKNHNTFDTQDIQNFTTGEFARYRVKSNYISSHIGAGYLLSLNKQNNLDLSVKYLWTQLAGKDVSVTGENIHFDRINSQRARFGMILSHQYSDTLAFTGGLSYEYEFDGKAKATALGLEIEAPSVKGGTSILSFGTTLKPTHNKNLSLDLKINGFIGKREGASASTKLNYSF